VSLTSSSIPGLPVARDPDGPGRDPDERGPKHRIWEGDYGWYVHPVTDERFVSVTTALEQIRKEDLDLRWRPALSAEAAFRELPRLIAATLTPLCGRTNGPCSRADRRQHEFNVRCDECPCGECMACLTKYLTYEHYRESARHVYRGSLTHNWIEDCITLRFDTAAAWAKFGDDTHRAILRKTGREPFPAELTEARDLIAPHVDAFLRFVEDFKLTDPQQWLMAEATVLNRSYMFGGTVDAQIHIHATDGGKSLELCERLGLEDPVVNYDTKTREKLESAFWFDHALQQAAYRRGEVILLDDGSEAPLNPADGAIVVQLMPGKYASRLVVTDDAAFHAFLGILDLTRWMINDAKAATLVRTHPRQLLPGISPAPKKRTPRKVTPATLVSAVEPFDGATDVQLPIGDIPATRLWPPTGSTTRVGRYESFPDDEIPF
jgi:hypothetical protein